MQFVLFSYQAMTCVSTGTLTSLGTITVTERCQHDMACVKFSQQNAVHAYLVKFLNVTLPEIKLMTGEVCGIYTPTETNLCNTQCNNTCVVFPTAFRFFSALVKSIIVPEQSMPVSEGTMYCPMTSNKTTNWILIGTVIAGIILFALVGGIIFYFVKKNHVAAPKARKPKKTTTTMAFSGYV
ncbi:Hypothetical_protein [Hexamita inflata]|uniref:Hypothetical_protein n=1 Tax=Hexamita inflata TaxID=28002 RepID=A0AA86N6C7_9EUKA|nr:Hypothetical protein HINF_LOCUS1221 [Hexamita inflata]